MKPPLARVPGTSVFLNRGKDTAPLAMRANVEHNEVLHEHVLILTIETMPVPHVPAAERIASTTSATETTGSSTSPPASATWTSRTFPTCCR